MQFFLIKFDVIHIYVDIDFTIQALIVVCLIFPTALIVSLAAV